MTAARLRLPARVGQLSRALRIYPLITKTSGQIFLWGGPDSSFFTYPRGGRPGRLRQLQPFSNSPIVPALPAPDFNIKVRLPDRRCAVGIGSGTW
eukprot:766442-Hanusia_phi.AAC.3